MSQPLDVQRLARTLHETLILGTLRTGPVHGYMIAIGIEERTGRYIKLRHGTLYPVLHHLEKQALIAGFWDEGEVYDALGDLDAAARAFGRARAANGA